jgi:lysophospholipase L1-like esterase
LGTYVNQTAFQDAKKFQPSIVIIMFGTNDANPIITPNPNSESFVAGYVNLAAEFQSLSTKPKIYLVKPPPIFSNQSGSNAEYFRDIIIPNIEKAANQTNLPVINVYSALANHPDFFPDGVHPNSEGAKLIAKEVYKTIILQNPS